MKDITYIQSLELIDIAANENRLYHHNGGQAYIRVSMDSNVLMIIDHSMHNHSRISLEDGTEYFIECANYNFEYSRRMREYGGLVNWYTKNTLLHEKDLV